MKNIKIIYLKEKKRQIESKNVFKENEKIQWKMK